MTREDLKTGRLYKTKNSVGHIHYQLLRTAKRGVGFGQEEAVVYEDQYGETFYDRLDVFLSTFEPLSPEEEDRIFFGDVTDNSWSPARVEEGPSWRPQAQGPGSTPCPHGRRAEEHCERCLAE